MLIAVVFVIAMVLNKMDMSIGDAMTGISEMGNARWFNLDSILEKSFFPRHFLSGALIAVVMTGMDQDMMQKNLTCRNIGEAKKNIFWFSISLFFVNIVFLFLGGLLYLYADQHGMDIPKGDQLFPLVAKDLGVVTAVIFTLGVIAAAYSSADSALTSLTTSFSLDILKMKEDQPKKRYIIHAGFSLILFIAVVIFEAINDDSVIVKLFTVAGYTYGPILGLFSFSLMSKRTVKDQWVPYIAISSVIVTFLIAQIEPDSIGGFKMGFELLLINGICTWSGLFAISKK